jgi:hypothetical protein
MGRRNPGKRERSWRAACEKAPPPPTDSPAIADWLPRSAPTGIIAMVTAIMLMWTWDRWPNFLVDFGRDLYTAAQLAQGKVLYRDIAFFTGPLSPYLNATWLSLFGPTLQTLVFCNVILFIGLLWLLYQVLRRVGSRTAATAATVVFVTMFGLADLVPMGNYNFICPYSHDMVHGLALSLGAILCLARYTDALSPRLAVLAGAQLGLVFLTRAEISFPAWMACGVGLAATLAYDPRAHAKRWAILAQVLAPALAVPLAALALLARHMPWASALRGVLGSWIWVFDAQVNGIGFYRESVGLDHVWLNLRPRNSCGAVPQKGCMDPRRCDRGRAHDRSVAPHSSLGAGASPAAVLGHSCPCDHPGIGQEPNRSHCPRATDCAPDAGRPRAGAAGQDPAQRALLQLRLRPGGAGYHADGAGSA